VAVSAPIPASDVCDTEIVGWNHQPQVNVLSPTARSTANSVFVAVPTRAELRERDPHEINSLALQDPKSAAKQSLKS
jgi:hypothetical protein